MLCLLLALALPALACNRAPVPVRGTRALGTGTPALPLTLPPRSRLRDGPCPAAAPALPLPSPLPAALASALGAVASALDASLDAGAVPGGGLVVSYGGQPLLSHFVGVADKASARAVTPDTPFRIASVSKVFPVVLLFQLADDGNVDLDDALAKKLPSFSIQNPFDSGAVTFRQLASHTAGLAREAPPGNTTAQVLAALRGQYLILPPGASPSYSNLGFALLGHALAEGVAPSAATLPELVQAAILDPLGLRRTGYNFTPSVLAALATGYGEDGTPVPFADLGWWFPAGSAYSSAGDLAALAQALMQQRGAGSAALGLSASRARELLAPLHWNRDGASLFGTPWECRASHGHLQLTKGGNLPGYTASMALVPDLNLSVAVTWNGGVDEVAWMDAALGLLLPALDAALAAAAPQPAYSPGPSPQDYLGVYAAGGSVLTVSMAQGMLVWHESTALKVSFFLEWFKSDPELGDLFRVAFPDSAFTCLLGEMEALRFQLVIFGRDCETGNVSTSSIPGWVPGAVWERM